MFSSDINIVEENGVYSLVLLGEFIQCRFTTDLVQSKNREFISFIAQDFDSVGKLELKNHKIINEGVNCAYIIYSIQKLKVENQKIWSEMVEAFRLMPKSDYALIRVANDPTLELEEEARFMPVKKVFREQLGEKSFKLLTSYAWGSYYQSMRALTAEQESGNVEEGHAGPGQLISDDDFKDTDSSKKIIQFIDNTTVEQRAALCALCEALEYKSLILPVAVLNKWISKNEYISAAMVLAGGVADLSGVHGGTDSSHQQLYTFHKDILELCLNYCDNSPSISEIKCRISKGENKNTEFKQTFMLDVKSRKPEKYIMDMCIKTLAGFLNSEGGQLLIGVKDDGKILGIKKEVDLIHKSEDKFLLHFKNKTKEEIGEKFFTLIEYQIVEVDSKKVLEISCAKSDEPVFIKKDIEFYVRVNPATHKLEGSALADYLRSHFYK